MQTLSYEAARPLIKSGDIINFYRGNDGWRTLGHALISFFTGSPIWHCGVAVWVKLEDGTDKLMLVETITRGGKRMVPLEVYSQYKKEVVPLPAQFSFEKMREKAMANINDQAYGYLDLITIGLHEFFGIPTKSVTSEVCSELVADLWVEAQVPLIDTHVSPGRLKLDLSLMGISATMTVLPG
jgi:hypothetical protein